MALAPLQRPPVPRLPELRLPTLRAVPRRKSLDRSWLTGLYRDAVSDSSEREGDRVATAIVRGVSTAPAPASPRTAELRNEPSARPETLHACRVGPRRPTGQPLPSPVREEMERHLGSDLGDVRLHVDTRASNQATELRARAFTVGQDVFFRHGEFAPHTRRGSWLLAHELTHTVQQHKNPGQPLLQRAPEGHEEASPTITCANDKYSPRLIKQALMAARAGSIAKLAQVNRVAVVSSRKQQRAMWNEGSFVCWFGSYRQTRLNHIRKVLGQVVASLRDPKVTVDCIDPASFSETDYDKSEYWASVRLSTKQITLRKLWYQAQYPTTRNPDPQPEHAREMREHEGRRANDRALTFVHEAAHLAGANRILKERSSGANECLALAKGQPWRAVRNADNYGWFVMDPRDARAGCQYEQDDWEPMRKEWDAEDEQAEIRSKAGELDERPWRPK
jgi:hypothetical protein